MDTIMDILMITTTMAITVTIAVEAQSDGQ